MAMNADKPAAAANKRVKRHPVKKKAVTSRPKLKRAVKKKAIARSILLPDDSLISETAEPFVAPPSEPEESAPVMEEAAVPAKLAPALVPSAKAIQESVTARAVRGVRGRDLTSFLRQLIMMLNAGSPLLKSLKSLSHRGEHQGIRDLVTGMTEYVEAGNPLWQAFARYKEFDAVFVNLIKASEASGTLTTVLKRLVRYREAREMLQKRVRAAMIYPVVVLVVCFAVLALITTVIVPEFVSMFEKFEIEIPRFTNAFIAVADFVTAYWFWVAVLVAGAIFAYKFLVVQSPVWRMKADRMKLRIPIFGPILRKNAVVDFTQTFALMLRSGLSMMATLDLCRNSVRNRAYVNPIQEMRDSVERGEGLEQPMRNAERSGLFPGVVVDMMITGEETGSVDVIAEQIGEIYEKEVEIDVAGISESMQPVITVSMGIVVGLIVFALFSPLVQMIEQISSAGSF